MTPDSSTVFGLGHSYRTAGSGTQSILRAGNFFSLPHLHGHEKLLLPDSLGGEEPVSLGFVLPSVKDSLFQERDGFSEPGRIIVHLFIWASYLVTWCWLKALGSDMQERAARHHTAFMEGKESALWDEGKGVSGYWALQ